MREIAEDECVNLRVVAGADHLDRYRLSAWEFAVKGSDGTLGLGISEGFKGCGSLKTLDVRESKDSVVVTVVHGVNMETAGRSDDGRILCSAVSIPAITPLKLKSPLGNRRILDGYQDDLSGD